MKVQVAGVTTTVAALQNSTTTVHSAALAAVRAGSAVLFHDVRKAVLIRDHTLQQLRQLDHPYARRHGSIRVHANRPWLVHARSLRLLHATKMRPAHGRRPAYEVYFDTGIAPHARYVVSGTRVMLARDPIWNTAREPAMRRKIMKAVVRVLGRGMRSKVGLRFGSAASRGRTADPGGGLISIR